MILQVEAVTKKFGGLVALNDVNVEVEEGEIVGIIGPNGAGKSTLLNVIAGVHQPNSGLIRFDGQKINDWPPEKICRIGIARTFQIPHPFPKMTPLENVLVAATFGQRRVARDPVQYARQVMEFVDYPVDEQYLAANLTTGQLRRLELARALASKPRLLLLDETAAGLTPPELVDLQNLILKIRNQGVTILIVEHLMRLIMQLCDRVVVLHYGVKIADGTPANIVEDENVTNAYLGEKYLLA
jgi:branched-chain amino acid transport system ATP-binding protein